MLPRFQLDMTLATDNTSTSPSRRALAPGRIRRPLSEEEMYMTTTPRCTTPTSLGLGLLRRAAGQILT